MDYATTPSQPKKKNIGQLTVQWVLRLWTYLINIGISEQMPNWNRKRIRLLNGICVMSILSLSWFVVTFTAPAERVIFVESFLLALFYLVILILNKKKKHELAFHLFCTCNILCYSFFAFAHGRADGAEYYLLLNGMSAMLFFKKTKIIVTYLFFSLLFFIGCKISFDYVHPLFTLPFNTYFSNQVLLFVLSFLIVAYFKTENLRQENLLEKQNKVLAVEKTKSDSLLLNILPNETAEELKTTGKAKPHYFESVTVMFTDFHNFTQIAAQMPPEKLVEEIHFCFSSFDHIVSKYGLEKIKTIGDAYMCAGGLPLINETHARDAVLAALDIVLFTKKRREEKLALNQPFFDVRIGIHSGPVVAGVVGTKKFAYDIWGDTVNVAARMESCGEEGKINISNATYELIKNHFNCNYRGKLNAKNKGLVDMYFVDDKLADVKWDKTTTYIAS